MAYRDPTRFSDPLLIAYLELQAAMEAYRLARLARLAARPRPEDREATE